MNILKIKKRILKIAIFMIMMFLIVGCNVKKVNEEKLEELVFTYVPSPLNVPSIIEKEKNIFNKEFNSLGIKCSYANIDSGADQTIALASSDIDILNAVGGSSVIIAAANDLDIKIISMYSKAPKAFMMYSNDESLNSPKDLVGKKIAGPMGTNLHELLVAYLQKENISINEVEFLSMDIPHSVAALEAGSIDVALVGGAATYKLEKSGKHKICDGDGLIAATILTCCTNDFYNKHKKEVEKFKNIQKSIIDEMNNNFDESMQITAKELDMNVEAVKEMYNYYDFSPSITDRDIELLKTTENFLFENKLIEKHVNIEDLIIK